MPLITLWNNVNSLFPFRTKTSLRKTMYNINSGYNNKLSPTTCSPNIMHLNEPYFKMVPHSLIKIDHFSNSLQELYTMQNKVSKSLVSNPTQTLSFFSSSFFSSSFSSFFFSVFSSFFSSVFSSPFSSAFSSVFFSSGASP